MSLASEARDRVLRLIDFLEAYDARKHPPVYDISDYRLFCLREGDLPDSDAIKVDPAAEAWLTVDFVELPYRPAIDEDLEPLLSDLPVSATERPVVELPDEPVEEDLTRAERAEAWIATAWEPWAAKCRQARRVKDLYRDLFEQRERLALDRDAVELVWGFGRLRWEVEGIVVDHPLLVIPAEIEIDGGSGQLRVRPAGAFEVEARHLAGLPVDDRAGYTAIRQSIEDSDSPPNPWDLPATRGLLRRLVRAIDHDGALVGEADAVEGAASIEESWVLYLRRRRPNYQGFLDSMRELYRAGAAVPDPLLSLVVDAPSLLVEVDDGDVASAPGQTEPLLLPLPTNEEQQRILELAQHRPGVTVQGPPGTGKSHTIANIISHYVAYGRRVLVVAEKEEALKVLAEKVPSGIRDLTVSVLGADEQGRRRLESAIGHIQVRVSGLDKVFSDRRISQLENELDSINRSIATTSDQLLSSRAAEVQRLEGAWEAGAELTPSTAAQWVAENATRFGYIDDDLGLETAAPITPGELAEAEALVGRIGVARAEACAFVLPELTNLPTGEELAEKLTAIDSLRAELESAAPGVRDWSALDAANPEVVMALEEHVANERDWSRRIAQSWLSLVASQLRDPLLNQAWRALASETREDRRRILDARQRLAAHRVEVPDNPEPSLVRRLEEAHRLISTRGKLGLFDGKAKNSLSTFLIDGRTPSTAPDVELCLVALELAETRRRLVTRWDNEVSRVSGPVLRDIVAEDLVADDLENLERLFNWEARWARMTAGLAATGIAPPKDPTPEVLDRLLIVLQMAARRRIERALSGELDALRAALADGSVAAGASPLWSLLADALERGDIGAWVEYRSSVADLLEQAPAALRLRQLRASLASAAPVWTSRILSETGAAGSPADLPAAWQWRQLETWLAQIRAAGDPGALQHKLEDLSVDRRRTVAEIVTERAWRRLADNIGDRQRQALNSYMQAIKRYGKTGGKYAARWLAEIRRALDESKDAVPVWVMTTSRALTSFRPAKEPPFDVLVVDEASQIGLEALPLLSLARTTIVVGDDKQTSPENVGLDQGAVFDLLDEHLAMVPAYRTLFDANNSLYDMAFQKFPDVVMLTEHFRCLPRIIEFSNLHAYDGRIVPLRDQAPSSGWSPLKAVKVADGYRRGDVNEPEAEAVVDIVAKMVADPAYDGMDFGVISLLGSSQSKLIWDKLYERIGPAVMAERRLRCGEPAKFQGDERDVIVLSTVVATDPEHPTARIGAMTGRPAERRINVAASRACEQMWVVHSVEPDRFPTGDLRAELIRHCQQPPSADQALDALESRCESDFERRVLRRLIARGYRRIQVQHAVGRYRIDIVVEGPDARLAVECDGDRWHGEETWHQDRARQQILERAGWTFERIRGSAFYRDPDIAMEPVWDRLETLGIPTGDEWVAAPTATASATRSLSITPLTGKDSADTQAAGESHAVAAPLETVVAPESVKTADPTVPSDFARPARVEGAERADGGVGDLAESAPLEVGQLRLAIEGDSPNPVGLARYRTWRANGVLTQVSLATRAEIVDAIAEIVAVEGPLHAIRAYELHARASGSERVRKEMRRLYNQAMNTALRSRRLVQIGDGLAGQIAKTIYLPGTPPVAVRELGPRRLEEVPRSEVQALMEMLGGSNTFGIKRAVLDAYGLVITERADAYLDGCITYRWNV